MELHIARSLEFLVDEVVHAAAGINETGGDDGQAATLSRIAGGTEEVLGGIKGGGVNPAGQGATTGGHRQVV